MRERGPPADSNAFAAPATERVSVGRRAPPPRLAVQPAVFIDCFRVLAGSALSAHYVQAARLMPQLLNQGLWQTSAPASATLFSALAVGVMRLGHHALQCWFTIGAILGGLIALGLAPRICAALLLGVSAAAHDMIGPARILDDYFAQAVPFWLLLLPTGRTLTPFAASNYHAWARARTGGREATECFIFFILFFLELSQVDDRLPTLIRIAILATALCAMAPIGIWRTLAIAPAAAALWVLSRFDGTGLACTLSAGLCILFVSALAKGWLCPPETDEVGSIGVASAIGACAVILLMLQVFSMNVGIPPVIRSTSAVLENMGLPSAWDTPLDGSDSAPFDVGFGLDGDFQVHADGLPPGNQRAQATLRLLSSWPPATAESARSSLIRGLVARHCHKAAVGDVATRENLFILRNGRSVRRLARFQCGRPGEQAKVSDLEGTSFQK